MKITKKVLLISVFAILCLPTHKVEAKRLIDYKNEVAALKAKKQETQTLSNEAANKIDAKRNAITAANNTISSNEKKVEASKVEVTNSKDKIVKKTEDLQNVIANLQYTGANTESVYLDYIFDADSISDLIEREAIIETITDDTQKQLESLEKLIKDNEALQVKLADDNVALEKSITQYEKQVEELDKYIDSLASIGLDYDSQIEAQEGLIKIYTNAGCQDNEDIDICYYAKINSSSEFSRPLNSGRVTQAWNSTHGGIDLGGNTPGVPVYAPASGTVVYTKYHYRCGGNIVYMHTMVNGKKYTIEFAHLRSYAVSNGQQVQKGTVIGYVGGDSTTWGYDKCTSGTHLHYAISSGYYFTDATWNGFYTFKSNTSVTANQSISKLNSSRGWKWSSRY